MLENNVKITAGYPDVPMAPLAGLPDYPGGEVVDISDLADGHTQVTIAKTDREDFLNFCGSLEADGYRLYAKKEIVDNLFCTYVKGSGMVHAYLTPVSGEARIIAAERALLPPGPVGYHPVCRETLTALKTYESPETGETADSLGYIFRFADGSFLVMDGGLARQVQVDALRDCLIRLAPDPGHIVIRAWFLSHQHGDHTGTLQKFAPLYSGDPRFTVESFMFNFCDTERQASRLRKGIPENTGHEDFDLIRHDVIGKYYPGVPVYKCLTGQDYYFPGARLEILFCMSDFIPKVIGTEYPDAEPYRADGNIQSVVTRLHAAGRSMLMTADIPRVECEVMCDRFGEYLRSDYITAPHHGIEDMRYRARNGSIKMYKLVDPEILLWPATADRARKRLSYWDGSEGSDYSAINYLYSHVGADNCVISGDGEVTLDFESFVKRCGFAADIK